MAGLDIYNAYNSAYKCTVYIRNKVYHPPVELNQKTFIFEMHPISEDSNPGTYLSIQMDICMDTIVSNIKVKTDNIFPLKGSKFNHTIFNISYDTVYDLAEWLDRVIEYHPFQSTIGTTRYAYYDCNNNYDNAAEYAQPIINKIIDDINNSAKYTLK